MGAAPGSIDHELRGQQPPYPLPVRGGAVAGAHPHTGDGVVAAPAQADGLVPGQEGHFRVGAQPGPDRRVDQVTARGKQGQAGVETGQPAGRAQHQQVPGHGKRDRPGAGQVLADTGEEPLQPLMRGRHQRVGVPGLGHPRTPPRSGGHPVALDHRDVVHEVGQGPCRREPGETGADDHGTPVATTRAGPRVCTQLGCPPCSLCLHHAAPERPRTAPSTRRGPPLQPPSSPPPPGLRRDSRRTPAELKAQGRELGRGGVRGCFPGGAGVFRRGAPILF